MNGPHSERARSGLDILFNPKSIAIAGASPDQTKFQGKILKYLLKHGYQGSIYPLNPRYESVMGISCYPSLSLVPAKIDLVIVILRSDRVLGVLQEAAGLGCRAAIVISSDFAESGEEGLRRQDQLTAFATESGMRILGPNCLGFINIPERITASGCTSLEKEVLLGGRIGLVTQSGALMGSIYGRAQDQDIGHSLVVSTGNEADVEASQVIRHMLHDPGTGAVTGFIESFRDLDNFLEVADIAVELGKPLVLLKVGQSEKGKQAAATHTAAMAGSDAVADVLFKKKGVVRVESVDQLYRTANLLLQAPLPQGDGLGIFTISGGACGWLADRCHVHGISVPDLSPRTKKRLSQVFQYGRPANPLDVTGQAISNQAYFSKLLNIFVEDENLDVILIGMTAMPFPKRAAEDLVRAARACPKPFIVFWTFDQVGEEAYTLLRQANVPLFHSSEACLRGIKHLIQYSRFRRELTESGPPPRYLADPEVKSRALRFLAGRSGTLTEHESKELLNIYGIKTTRERLTSSQNEALEAADEIGYPVALKIMSPAIVHKTDVGVLRTNVQGAGGLRTAYREIVDTADKVAGKADVRGVLVQEMVTGEAEVYAGLINDRVFGLGVLFGMGGTLVEIFDDTAVGIPPLSLKEATAMVTDIRAGVILLGFRGDSGCDLKAIADVLVRLGEIGLDLAEYVAEIDLNPIMVFAPGNGLKVIDATVTLKEHITLDKRKEDGYG